MAKFEETALPGVGVRRDFGLESGQRVGVVARRDGERDLVVYERDDPESCRAVVRLSREDARSLGELLARSDDEPAE